VAEIRDIEEGPTRRPSISFWGHREIRDPGDKRLVHFEIVKRDTPISGGQLSAYPEKWKPP
jgi:hypothetical protein